MSVPVSVCVCVKVALAAVAVAVDIAGKFILLLRAQWQQRQETNAIAYNQAARAVLVHVQSGGKEGRGGVEWSGRKTTENNENKRARRGEKH